MIKKILITGISCSGGSYLAEHILNKKGTLYIGNDLNDMDAFDYVDYSLCPSDSHEKVLARCDFILNSQGGQGVFRELLIALESN